MALTEIFAARPHGDRLHYERHERERMRMPRFFRVFRDFRGSKSFQVLFVDDNGFANDAVKINVEQLFKMLSPQTEVKTL